MGAVGTVQWGVILGVILPLLTAVVQQPTWSQTVRRIVATVLAVAVGIGTAWFNGELSHGTTVVAACAAVLVAAQATYHTLWGDLAPAIEAATSPDQDRVVARGRRRR